MMRRGDQEGSRNHPTRKPTFDQSATLASRVHEAIVGRDDGACGTEAMTSTAHHRGGGVRIDDDAQGVGARTMESTLRFQSVVPQSRGDDFPVQVGGVEALQPLPFHAPLNRLDIIFGQSNAPFLRGFVVVVVVVVHGRRRVDITGVVALKLEIVDIMESTGVRFVRAHVFLVLGDVGGVDGENER